MAFDKNEMNLLNTMREVKEQKTLKNLLSRKNLDLRELDNLMCGNDY